MGLKLQVEYRTVEPKWTDFWTGISYTNRELVYVDAEKVFDLYLDIGCPNPECGANVLWIDGSIAEKLLAKLVADLPVILHVCRVCKSEFMINFSHVVF